MQRNGQEQSKQRDNTCESLEWEGLGAFEELKGDLYSQSVLGQRKVTPEEVGQQEPPSGRQGVLVLR